MKVLFGFVSVPTNLTRKPEPVYNIDDYCQELKYKLRKLYEVVHRKIQTAKEKSKKYYDENGKDVTFAVGDNVFKINKHRTSKLSPKYEGPFKVIAVHENNVTIQTGKTQQRVHKNLIKQYRLVESKTIINP